MARNMSAKIKDFPDNPCCSELKAYCIKVSEGRLLLKNAIKILEDQINSLQKEQCVLQNECKEQKNRADVLEEEKAKETFLKTSLENEVAALKLENCSAKPDVDCKNEELEKETVLLRGSISEKDEEIERLKQLLADEQSTYGKGKRVSASEKKKIADLQKNLQNEKKRADEACKVADAANKKSEEDSLRVETLNNEVKSISRNLEEANKMLVAEKQKVDDEIARAKIVEDKMKSLEIEKLDLQKACKDQKNRADILEAEKEKEASLRLYLEGEVTALKSDKFLIKPGVDCKYEELEKETIFLRDSISEKDGEIERLKQLLADEKPASGKGKKAASSEKKKIADLQKNLENEKNRVVEAWKIAESAKRTSEEDRLLAETLKKEVKVISRKLEEANRMFEAEKQRVLVERKKADEETAKANELKSIAEVNEKIVADKNCHAHNLSVMLKEEKQKVEKLEKELQTVMSVQMSALSSQVDELNKNLEVEKEKVVTEKKRADVEMSEKEVHKKAVEANMTIAKEEKGRSDKLSKDLQNCRQIVENLQLELTNVKCMLEADRLESAKEKERADLLDLKLKEQKIAVEVEKAQLDKLGEKVEAEKNKAAVEKKRAYLEMSAKEEQKRIAEANIKKVMEEKHRADKLLQDLLNDRQRIKSLEEELNKVNHMLEAERLVSAKERNHADFLSSKLEEQATIAIEYEKRATEEKCRSDNMVQELENVREKLKDVENQLCEVKHSKGISVACNVPSGLVNGQITEVSLLQDRLEFEKEQVKHYKEVARLEKDRNIASQQELHNVNQDFQCLLQQMDLLRDTFTPRNHKKRRLNEQSLELHHRTPSSSSPQVHFCCDRDPRLSSLSSRDTSCHLTPNTRLADAMQPLESPSGMKTDLKTLVGVSHGDVLASSALNFNTASFSDVQLPGSLERVADSLTTQAELAARDPDRQATMTKLNDGTRVATVADIDLVELEAGHVNKWRKIIDGSESNKCMLSQGKKISQAFASNELGLHNVSALPVIEQREKVNLPLTSNNDNLCANFEMSGKKRKAAPEPQVVLPQVDGSAVPLEMDKLTCSAQMTSQREISQAEQAAGGDLLASHLDDLVSFEQELNGDYMKLLDLDDVLDEEHFRMALEFPLSPTLPDFPLHGFDKDNELQMFSSPICSTTNASDTIVEHDKIPSLCVVYSDMGDISCISRIFCATKACVARSSLLQTHLLMKDILVALDSEKDLVPREKICVFFSLLILYFVGASFPESSEIQRRELSDDLFAHLQSVLLNVETRHLFTKVCSLADLLCLSEDFLLHKKILLCSSTSGPLNYVDSDIEILYQGCNYVLGPNLASANMVVAGSIVLASISVAAGLVDSLCAVSLKIARTITTRDDCAMSLLILHTFAYVCEEYFTISNYYSVMEVVKFIVASAESSLTMNGHIQSGDGTWHRFFLCDGCPFAESSIGADDIASKLLEEVQGCTEPCNQDRFDSRFLVDVLSSLELLAAHMKWVWVYDKIVSKLCKILESCDLGSIMLTSVIGLLGHLGRLGLEAEGYDDSGVKNIIGQLSTFLRRTTALKCSTLSMAIVQALIELQPNGHEALLKSHEDQSIEGIYSEIVTTMFSYPSTEQISALQPILNRISLDMIA